jgi:gas vesicle protein
VNSTQQGPIAKTISLLLDPKVQKELQLATPQLKRIKESVDSLKESFMPRIRKVQSLSDSEKSKARPKLIRDVIRELDSILEKAMRPEQVTRFQQIRLQKEGIAAFFDETVRDGLDLSPEQGAQIKSILQDGVRKTSAAQRGTPGNRAQLVAEAQKKTEDAILGALSTEQAARWNAMRGAPFSFESTGGPARDTSARTIGGPKNTELGRDIESTRMAGRGTAGPGMSGPGSGGPSAVARSNDPYSYD